MGLTRIAVSHLIQLAVPLKAQVAAYRWRMLKPVDRATIMAAHFGATIRCSFDSAAV